jgi:hypothetical protein
VPLKTAINWIGVLIALVCFGGCDLSVDRFLYGPGKRIDEVFSKLEGADRIIVKGGNAGLQEVATITDEQKVRDVLVFFERFPDGWVIFSGSPGQYRLYLYHDQQLLGTVGLTASSSDQSASEQSEDVISVGSYYRRAPSSAVAALALRLGLQWPPDK